MALKPIYNLGAESAVIGSIFSDPSSWSAAGEIIQGGDFFSETHSIYWIALGKMIEQSLPMDFLHMQRTLEAMAEKDRAGFPGSMAEILALNVSSLGVLSHAKIVREMSARRKILEGARSVAVNASSEEFAMDDLAREVAQLADHISDFAKADGRVELKFASEKLLDSIQNQINTGKKEPILQSGYWKLDSIIQGFRPGEITVIAGTTGKGKSALALNIACNIARSGHAVGFISLEMEARELMQRIYAHEAMVKNFENVTPEEWERLKLAEAYVKTWKIYIDEQESHTPATLRSSISRMKKVDKCEIVFLDYYQLVHDPDVGNELQELNLVSSALRAEAKRLQIPIIVLAQLNDQHLKEDRKPTWRDIKGTRKLSEDAHRILCLHWLGPKSGTLGHYEVELIVAKQRRGRSGVEVEFEYNGPSQRFEESLPEWAVTPAQ